MRGLKKKGAAPTYRAISPTGSRSLGRCFVYLAESNLLLPLGLFCILFSKTKWGKIDFCLLALSFGGIPTQFGREMPCRGPGGRLR